MWFKRKQIKCFECKHYVDIEDSQFVQTNWGDMYYCPMHKKPYDIVGAKSDTIDLTLPRHSLTKLYYRIIPEHRIEVDEEGKEVVNKRK